MAVDVSKPAVVPAVSVNDTVDGFVASTGLGTITQVVE